MARQTVNRLDYTTRDYEGFRELMIAKLQELMPEYTDLRQSDAGVVILELNAMCLDILSYYLDSVANECFLATAEQRSNIMKFCKMLGYTPRYATSAVYEQIFIKGSTMRAVVIPEGTKVKTTSTTQSGAVYFTTLETVTIPAGAMGDEQDSDGNYLYSVPVIHGLFVRDEILTDNSRTGVKNQTYSLRYAPALIDDEYFSVYVNTPTQASEKWSRVNSFAGASSDSKVYTLEVNDYNETSVVFGDGNFGMIPESATITCSYYVGGGDSGNVGIGAINALEDNIAGVTSTLNVSQKSIGYDQETLDEIKMNAPVSHRTIWGALTCSDFAGVLKVYFPYVQDAEAEKASDDWTQLAVDDINLYFLTKQEVDYQTDGDVFTPIPNSFYSGTTYTKVKQSIADFFNSDVDYVDIGTNTTLDAARKIVGARNAILKHPVYAPLTLSYDLVVQPYYNPTSIAEEVESYLKRYFRLGKLNFNEDVSLQEIIYEIIETSGIDGIRYLNMTVEGDKDSRGEIHATTAVPYDFLNNDLIVPAIGTMLVLGSVSGTAEVINARNSQGGVS